MYHYGLTIKEHRELKGITQAELAEKWVKSDGNRGVTVDYVSSVETGRKSIVNQKVLRSLCEILDIPLWKLGLGEYDPFNENEIVSSYPFLDLNALLELIQDTWFIRLNMPAELVERKIIALSDIFTNLINRNPNILDNKDFLVLYAQLKRLQEVVYTERKEYSTSLKYSHDMLEIAKQSGDVITESTAMVRIGVELLRDENINALDYLEQARDLSFLTSSKELAAYCYTFLARGYATFGDEKRFIQTINTAITLADSMKGLPVTTKDYIYHAYSAILEEKTNGLILFGKGKEAFEGMDNIDLHIDKERNSYLKMWIPLDKAQSLMHMREIEESIKYLELFYNNVKNYASKRIHSTVEKHLRQLENIGYTEVSSVKRFKEMYKEQ